METIDYEERVAKAIADGWHDPIVRWNAEAKLPPHRHPPWDSEAHIWLPIARAAIEAHKAALQEAGFVIVPREPTLAMLDTPKIRKYAWRNEEPVSLCDVRQTWHEMIDAHLKDGK